MSNGGLSAASSNVAETVLISPRLKIPKIRGKTIAAARYRFQLLGAGRSTALPQRKMVRAFMFAFVYWCLTFVPVAEALENCAAGEQVCAFSKFVFKVEIGGRVGSAVYAGRRIVVANRHIVLDDSVAKLTDKFGQVYTARVIPNDQHEDLVLLDVDNLDRGPLPWRPEAVSRGESVHIVGYEQATNAIKVFPAGIVLLPPAANRLSRIQHIAKAATGSSGAGLVTADGKLVGIATSGDERRGDAIPVGRVGALEAHSSEQHRVVHDAIGRQYKTCQETLRRMPIRRARLAKRAVEYLTRVCRKTRNTHLLNDAGQILGRAGHVKEGKAVFSQALELDPYALNNRIGLVVILLLSGGATEALPHAKWLYELLPHDKQVLRLAVQTGKRGGDIELARQALTTLENLDPALAVPLRSYLAR